MSTNTTPGAWIDEVSSQNLMDTTRSIAQWVRLSGSEDERKAFDFLDETLKGYGLSTRLHLPTCLVSLPVSAELEAGGQSFHCITHAFSVSTDEHGVAGQLVYAGGGTLDELLGAGATGKIAITDGLATPQKAFAATEAGVRALINISGDQIHEMIVSGVWGSPTPDTLPLLPSVPVISVDSESGKKLRDLEAAGPARATVKTTVDTCWRPIPVMIADLDVDGRDYIMFSGHVDSWHYGAMDNGSANATMVEVARVLSGHRDALRRGLRLAFWSGHSHARYAGSTWFADAYWHELRERCVAHVNVDSTGGIGATDLTTANAMAETYELAKDVIKRQTGQELIYQRFGRAGDQSFWGVGLPALFMSVSHQGQAADVTQDMVRLVGGTTARGGGLGWWWHTTEDTIDKIDPANLERDTRIYVEVIGRLATEPVIPLDIRGPLVEMTTELDDIEQLWAGMPSNGDDDTVSFDALRADLAAAREAADRLYASAGAADGDRASRAIVDACKKLMPVNYTSSGEFDHDLAMGARTLPSLRPPMDVVAMSVNEQWASLHALRRSMNRVRAHVQAATAILSEAG